MSLPNLFQIWTACQYMVFFWIGFKIRQHGSDLLMRIPALVWIAVDIGLFAVIKFIPSDSMLWRIVNLGMSFSLHIIGAIMAFCVLQKIATRVKWQNSKVFLFFAKRSMPIYLFHQQVVYFSIYLLNGLVNPYLHVAINFAVAMAVSLLISSIMLKFKCTRLLIGEK